MAMLGGLDGDDSHAQVALFAIKFNLITNNAPLLRPHLCLSTTLLGSGQMN